MKTLRFALPLLAGLTVSLSGAQSTPAAPGSVTVWAGLSSEVLILPAPYAALSVPLSPGMALRGGVQYLPGEAALGADLLFGAAARGFYGGPSAALIVGDLPGWLAGGVLGYRNSFGGGRWGYFVEGKARYLFLKNGASGHEPWSTPQDLRIVSPGLGLGLTYRF
ncbi:hypothetical protein DEIPH_ctg010orf0028 [Deinococcus phoenicis]|uniref:Outer membrane protein beta-barrel domain-containing protein n=1 Tax=Deinococcus phoenicis TaxID=1476583 RepID=A0A016QTY2_9DEIO|nr:hypothetical protein [Deinococcus phoenicis]EYB69259.1 hypothetical protein DEIPH_ctg010orf0028 [Deinococcus phoenicis]